ncbi:KTSC domain-containing protein [Paraflavitalea sp. CAU 1676]|uniref:KTSC domain-containing protein n=1 Tax=Paraflavitalea sp. CAU 1676 TaxID=3032598 RepID=UPI0023DA1DE5|nr:KTSC domain-containing protein [Paraflavitalea sp. CAU 1676]MDF2192156.1 KTSC domain-containing protein [Paraflavitalea sp. CAU 1676]
MPSTVIAHIEYIPTEEVLRIAFNPGAIYEYLQVPESVYKDLQQYREKAFFLNKYIKAKYTFKKATNG